MNLNTPKRSDGESRFAPHGKERSFTGWKGFRVRAGWSSLLSGLCETAVVQNGCAPLRRSESRPAVLCGRKPGGTAEQKNLQLRPLCLAFGRAGDGAFLLYSAQKQEE